MADELTARIVRTAVADYLAEVKQSVLDWFARQSDSSLDAPVALRANQERRAGYLDPNIWAEVADLDGLTGWQFLLRPAIGHVRRHMGEYDVLVGALRTRAKPRA